MKFTLSKEMMPDSFNGTDRMKFLDCEFEISKLLSPGDYGRHPGVDRAGTRGCSRGQV